MKTIGLLGGMSWESTVSYYQAINRAVKAKLGGLHSAKICMRSVDFQQIEQLQHQSQWQSLAEILVKEARLIERGGADCLLICTNTMHKVANHVEQQIDIPLLHIADATAQQLIVDNRQKVGLLGTAFTMQQDFYKGRLSSKFGLEVLVPNPQEQTLIHTVIYQELCLGKIVDASRHAFLRIVDGLVASGADAIILGCTEIALLLKPEDTAVPLYDTAEIHAKHAVDWVLG